MLYEILIVVYLIVALCLIGLVLIQQGKGADMGASFGAGASATIFGSSGSGNFLTKSTSILAVAFFLISLILGNLTAHRVKSTDEWNNLGKASSQPTKTTVTTKSTKTTQPVASAEAQKVLKNQDVPVNNSKKSTVNKKDTSDIPHS